MCIRDSYRRGPDNVGLFSQINWTIKGARFVLNECCRASQMKRNNPTNTGSFHNVHFPWPVLFEKKCPHIIFSGKCKREVSYYWSFQCCRRWSWYNNRIAPLSSTLSETPTRRCPHNMSLYWRSMMVDIYLWIYVRSVSVNLLAWSFDCYCLFPLFSLAPRAALHSSSCLLYTSPSPRD